MLEEKDLQAIRSIMKEEVQQAEQRITKKTESMIDAAEQRIAKNTVTLMDAEFSKKFDLLAEGQKLILEKLERLDDLDVIDTRVTALEAMVKKLNRDVNRLKQAQ